jgi:hypothetical protein
LGVGFASIGEALHMTTPGGRAMVSMLPISPCGNRQRKPEARAKALRSRFRLVLQDCARPFSYVWAFNTSTGKLPNTSTWLLSPGPASIRTEPAGTKRPAGLARLRRANSRPRPNHDRLRPYRRG